MYSYVRCAMCDVQTHRTLWCSIDDVVVDSLSALFFPAPLVRLFFNAFADRWPWKMHKQNRKCWIYTNEMRCTMDLSTYTCVCDGFAHRSRFISHSPLDLGLFIHSHSMLSPVSCVNWVLRGFHLRSFGLQIWLRSGLVVLLSSSLWLQQLWCIENLGIDWKPCDYISWICILSSTLPRMSSTLLANPSTILWLQHTRLPSQCWRLCYPKTSQKSDVHTALRAHVSTFSEFNCKFWQYSKCIPCSRFSV